MADKIKVNMKKLQETIQAIEDTKEISIRELCRKMGADESYLTRVKLGHYKQISLEKLGDFCKATGLNPYDFFEGRGRIIDIDTLPPDLADEIWQLILKRAIKK